MREITKKIENDNKKCRLNNFISSIKPVVPNLISGDSNHAPQDMTASPLV